MKKKIILLISGKGTNALNIIKYFINSDSIQVCLVLSNNQNSPLFENLIDYNVPAEYFDIETFDDEVFEKIKKINPDLIVLAGFLKKISLKFLAFFPKKNYKYSSISTSKVWRKRDVWKEDSQKGSRV